MPTKPITIRIYNSKTKAKSHKLARKHLRFLSQEVEWIVQQYIEDYEAKYGEIKIDNGLIDEEE